MLDRSFDMKKSKDNEIKSLKKIIKDLKNKIKKLEQGETFYIAENKKLSNKLGTDDRYYKYMSDEEDES